MEPYEFVARGDYGALYCDAHGRVLWYDSTVHGELVEHAEYTTFRQADVVEYLRWAKCTALPDSLDIVAIGWWLTDGTYLAASGSYRVCHT
jgi:hypothetical protein